MFLLKTAKTNEIYTHCIKSMLKHDLILKCLMSDDSKKTNDILSIITKKPDVHIKKKSKMDVAEKVFQLVKGDADVKKSDGVKKSKPENLSLKLNELIKKAEVVPESLQDNVPQVEKTPRKLLKESDERERILLKAEKIALALGVDVSLTQKELLTAFESCKGNVPLIREEPRIKEHFKRSPRAHTSGQEHHLKNVEIIHLDIFKKNVGEKEAERTLQIWSQLKEIDLMNFALQPPDNYFEELINWTVQGKLWHFPIDNDQGWDEEIATDFTDHIFLDKHLEPWCPQSGPIRQFMELVTTGLSKNPYLSAKQKKGHILWYRDYFQAKSSLLNELGLLNPCTDDAEVKKLEAGESTS